jgi:hypothetical protein
VLPEIAEGLSVADVDKNIGIKAMTEGLGKDLRPLSLRLQIFLWVLLLTLKGNFKQSKYHTFKSLVAELKRSQQIDADTLIIRLKVYPGSTFYSFSSLSFWVSLGPPQKDGTHQGGSG